MKLKRNLYVVLIAIVMYFTLTICYEKFVVKDESISVYSVSKNVSRGDKIIDTDLKMVKVFTKESDRYLTVYPIDEYYRDDYIEGTILLNNMVLKNNEYMKAKLYNEILSIKLNYAEDAASYQIEKGSVVNIFYSAKLAEIDNIINTIKAASVSSNNAENGYVTLKLFDKVKILSCYDKYGNVAKKGNIVETILIEVSKEESIKINNLKNYGKFSISIIK